MEELVKCIMSSNATDLRNILITNKSNRSLHLSLGMFISLAEKTGNKAIQSELQEFVQVILDTVVGKHSPISQGNSHSSVNNLDVNVHGAIEAYHDCAMSMNVSRHVEKLNFASGNDGSTPLKEYNLSDSLYDTDDIVELDCARSMQFVTSAGNISLLSSLLSGGLSVDLSDSENKVLLHHAAASDSVESIQTLLLHGALCDAKDLMHMTPLMVGCRQGAVKAVNELIQSSMDVNHTDMCEQTALHYACKTDCLPCVELLLDAGADLRPNRYMETEIMVALSHNGESIIQTLIDHGVDVNSKTRQGSTALHYSARYDCPEAAEILCNANGLIDLQDSYGYTPIAVAAKNGHTKVLETLLKYVTNISTLEMDNKSHNNAVTLAVMMGHKECVQLLLEAGAGIHIETTLMAAAQNGHTDILALLISWYKTKYGLHWYLSGLEGVNKLGMSPLHVAAMNGHLECVRLLLHEGANPSQTMRTTQETPLMLAVISNYTDITKELLKYMSRDFGKIGINQLSCKRKTALHYAAKQGSLECAELLVSEGAALNMKDSRNYTPLLLAVEGGHLNVIRLLFSHGCDRLAQWGEGWNALHLAVFKNHLDCVCFLLQAGMKPDCSTWISQVTPACLAAEHGHSDILRVLLDRGASVDLANYDGMAPLHHAAKNNHVDCIDLLVLYHACLNLHSTSRKNPAWFAIAEGSYEALTLLIFNNCDVSGINVLEKVCPLKPGCDWVLPLLLQAGCSVDPIQLGNFLVDNNFPEGSSQHSILHYSATQPRTLKELCRLCVRARMGQGLFFINGVVMLPIPRELRKYVGLEHECLICDTVTLPKRFW